MNGQTTDARLDRIVASLESVALRKEVPAEVAAYARAVTRAALADHCGPGLRSRAEAYFNAVVRRRLLRRHGGTPAAVRIVVDTMVADLLDSGRSAEDVWRELSRGWGEVYPEEVMEEYRRLLCA